MRNTIVYTPNSVCFTKTRGGLVMLEEKDYDSLNTRYIGTYYGDLRRERASLMKRLCHDSDVTVKPRIREITQQMLDYMKAKQ